jgi:hypothetical protein
MPAALARHLAALSSDEQAKLFGDITQAAAFPVTHDIRIGVSAGSAFFAGVHFSKLTEATAYDEAMGRMVLAAAALAVVPAVLAFWMPNWYLADKQSVAAADCADERHSEGRRSESESIVGTEQSTVD